MDCRILKMIPYLVQFIEKTVQAVLHNGIVRFLLVSVFFVFTLALSNCAEADGFDTSQDNWAVISGYGQSFPGWGNTSQRVETIDLIPRYNHHIFDMGSGWYRGVHSLMLELPVSVVVSHDVSAMIGMNFLACYTFNSAQQWQPYLFGGGGPVYSFADIPGMGADLNGNYQFGIGVHYDWGTAHQLLFELRYHHISNAGTAEPNDPLNSLKVLIGITF
jgi:hypothetical protein